MTAPAPDPAPTSLQLAHAAAAGNMLGGAGIEARVGRANALATLALVEETRALREAQDTANLIAVYTAPPEACEALTSQAGLTPDAWVTMATQIKERLGL